MQFKHPELLYALLLLIIPILIHLFQLRRFQKVAFTNVKFLKELTLQTRKSSQLKKWLTLLTRLLLLTCVILAFAQPYLSDSKSFNTKNETVIYLDNSFSMQAKGQNGTLLNNAIQDIIETLDEDENISVFTNDITYPNTTLKAIKNELIQLSYSTNQLTYESVLLKGKKTFSKDKNSLKHLIMVSDFQEQSVPLKIDLDSFIKTKLVQLKPISTSNISIDSVYVSEIDLETYTLKVNVKNLGASIQTLPISLFNDEKLIAKSSINLETETSTEFTLPVNQRFNGKLILEDQHLTYDNSMFFNIDKQEKINVLSINEADDEFLSKIYTIDEFDYQSFRFNAVDYNVIEDQNLIILNELIDIPNSLITTLKAFTNNGGSLLIIPSNEITLSSYNQLFREYNLLQFDSINKSEKRITEINFSHPLLINVFDKKVSNFQYPKVNSYYTSRASGSTILKYEDGNSFLVNTDNSYAFTGAINEDNSNFKNSPLIVPVLYNVGKRSLKLPKLYYTIGTEHKIDIKAKLLQDDILAIGNDDHSIIPLQQTYTNKVELITNEYPKTAGVVSVKNKDAILKTLSFNYPRKESELKYLNIDQIDNASVSESIVIAIDDIKSATNVNELWKWFITFALVLLVIEMLILKFLK